MVYWCLQKHYSMHTSILAGCDYQTPLDTEIFLLISIAVTDRITKLKFFNPCPQAHKFTYIYILNKWKSETYLFKWLFSCLSAFSTLFSLNFRLYLSLYRFQKFTHCLCMHFVLKYFWSGCLDWLDSTRWDESDPKNSTKNNKNLTSVWICFISDTMTLCALDNSIFHVNRVKI